MLRPLYPRHPLDRRLDGPQSRSGLGGKGKSLHCPCWESNPGRPDRSLVTMLTVIPRLYGVTEQN